MLFHGVIFLLIDKSDEYQLCQFILGFKGLQAITVGIMGLCIGSSLYIQCINKAEPDCETHGPGADLSFEYEFFFELGIFAFQIIMVWAAFLMLPCSEVKGATPRPRVKRRHKKKNQVLPVAAEQLPPPPSSRAEEEEIGSRRGGRLRKMLYLDTFVFLAIAGGAVAVWVAIGWSTTGHHVRQLLFWCRTLYGLLSLPFVVFLLPLADRLLTHARPTGYDQYGNTVPSCEPREMVARRKAKENALAEAAAEP